LKFGKQKLIPGSLSVFTDSRLLLRRLRGELLPFSKDVTYIFDQQLEEAGVIVMNKMDLLNPVDLHQLEILVAQKWPKKIRLMASALSDESIQDWLSVIGQGDTKYLGNSIDLDYYQYASGETKLAWQDQTITITSGSPNIRSEIVDLIQSMITDLDDVGAPIGHLKFFINSEHTHTKISITTQHSTDWESQMPELIDGLCTLIINARVELPSTELEIIMSGVIQNSKLPLQVNDTAIFHPSKPTPTYRLNY
jgi:G3E family GTPase